MTDLSPPLQKSLAQAFAFLQKGEPRRAAPLLKRVLKATPDHADALHGLGLTEKAAGRLKRAVEFLERAQTGAPENPAIAANLGNLYRETGRLGDAIACYRMVVAAAPQRASAHRNLGALLQENGEPAAAREHFEKAVALDPGDADAHSNLGASVRELDGIAAALPHFDRAIACVPDHAGALFNRANAVHEAGDNEAAATGYERVVALDPGMADAWFNLHALRFDIEDLAPARAALQRAVEADPAHAMARGYLAMVCAAMGETDITAEQRDWIAAHAPEHLHLLDSWDYAAARRTPEIGLFADTYRTLGSAFARAPETGLILEFGVHRGNSIRYLAGLAAGTERAVHGFDSFEGLPEGWKDLPGGSYTTRGELPAVPDNVALHVGWFDETLPGFVEKHPEPVAFINIDCDLYSSTMTVFDVLGAQIGPGTVIVFDEYICNPTWRDDEYKAFQEFVAARGLAYEYLAFSPFTKQAAVLIR